MDQFDAQGGEALLTTREVARLIGVGPTSVKRWADAGLLPCVKTAGGHRRFLRDQVDRFLEAQGAMEAEAFGEALEPAGWIELLRSGRNLHAVQARLMGERARLGAWWRVAENMGAVLELIGDRWADGELTVIEEHLAAEQLHRALAHCVDAIPAASNGRRCLLVTAEHEAHTLGLSLAEVCAREVGWTCIWAGARTPAADVGFWAKSQQVDLVGISASCWSADADDLRRQASVVREALGEDPRLVLGGAGAWPEDLSGVARVRGFEEFHRLLLH